MKKSLELIDQLIEIEKVRDEEWKKLWHSLHQDTKTFGEGITLFHLKQLKELVEKEVGELKEHGSK